MRLTTPFALALLVTAPALANDVQPANPSTPLPGWLAGAWVNEAGGTWQDEYWTPPRGGIMIGAARVGEGKALQFWESTRIERRSDGRVFFVALPRGSYGGEFAMSGQGADWIEFAEPAHDYPQRIRYWREGDRLLAEISLIDGSKPQRFEYRMAEN